MKKILVGAAITVAVAAVLALGGVACWRDLQSPLPGIDCSSNPADDGPCDQGNQYLGSCDQLPPCDDP